MGKPGHILMVDDSRTDAQLTREALQESRQPIEFTWIDSGAKALGYLQQLPGDGSAAWPDLILLDLNMPGLSGWDVLTSIKQDQGLKRIPVLILSSSSRPHDVRRAYELEANCYLTKPMDWNDYCRLIHAIETFWLSGAVQKMSPPPTLADVA